MAKQQSERTRSGLPSLVLSASAGPGSLRARLAAGAVATRSERTAALYGWSLKVAPSRAMWEACGGGVDLKRTEGGRARWTVSIGSARGGGGRVLAGAVRWRGGRKHRSPWRDDRGTLRGPL